MTEPGYKLMLKNCGRFIRTLTLVLRLAVELKGSCKLLELIA